jgi:sugar/nucleoside kinase (ribokinase family)
VAVVKDGAGGSYIAYKNEVIHVPAPSVKVVDTTGAGDFFAGGFLAALCRGFDLETCGKVATIMGAEVVQHMGVRYSAEAVTKARNLLQL